MSEKAPAGPSVLDKLRVKLANDREKIEEQFAREQQKLDEKAKTLEYEELFGKYDEKVTPVDGELTYEEYLEHRPSEGVYRKGENYHDARSGNFVTTQAYEAQLKSTVDYENEVGDLLNKGEYEPPHYDEMSYLELVQASAAARELGDRAADDDVRTEIKERLTIEIVNEGNDDESSEAAQARFDTGVRKFEFLVDQLSNGHEAIYDGDQVVLGKSFTNGDEKVFEVYDDDGVAHLVYERELTLSESAQGVAEQPVDTPDADVEDDVDEEVNEPVVPYAHAVTDPGTVNRISVLNHGENGVRVEIPAEPQAVEVAKEEPVVTEEETTTVEERELSRTERVKNWFSREGRRVRDVLGVKFWSARFATAEKVQGVYRQHILNHGITESMSPEEQQKKRERNRHVFAAGAIGVGVLGILALGVSAYNDLAADQAPSLGTDLADIDPSKTPPVDAPVTPEPEVLPVPEAPVPMEAFNVPSGGGGEQLFTDLGIDPSQWYVNENTLLTNFPNDFYRMADGHVGIAHSGWISPEAQDFIKTLI